MDNKSTKHGCNACREYCDAITPLARWDLFRKICANPDVKQEALAAILGVHKSTVSRWREDGIQASKTPPSLEKLLKISLYANDPAIGFTILNLFDVDPDRDRQALESIRDFADSNLGRGRK